ncbi:MAG: hypothetical protein MJY82_06330 [Fibrobacter sp.]|nr:hypothetical protein [Fibrobacter sp.]
MESAAYCRKSDLIYEGGWGGEIENDDECGETLPECQSDESSSSQGEESSSSELASSSSQENSSSSQVNSSSSQEEYISSDETVSDDSDSSGYAGGGSKGFECEGFTMFQKRPKMIDKIELREFKPFCSEEGVILMAANIPYLDIIGEYRCSDIFYDYLFYCEYESAAPSEGCHGYEYFRHLYYYIDSRQLWIGSEVVNFSAKYGLFPYFDVDELYQKVADFGVAAGWDLGPDLKNLYPELSISTFEDYVKACALYSGIEWETLSSSAGSLDESSSSVEIDWDYYSSSEESSSSEVELSSSSEIQTSSSEEIASSSSDEFVPGEDQVYTPDQIFRSGLQNMEPGACYSLNPDRGTIYGWNISYDASDTWWWQKVDCETGEKAVGNGIGACSAYSESVPLNVSGCYSYNGSCYICDKSKGDYVDCNAVWLWKYNFPTHDWFKQVDCYNPYEGEDCPDPSYLLKKSAEIANGENANYVNENYGLDFVKSSKTYNALGQNVKRPGKWEMVYEKTLNRSFNLVTNGANIVNTHYLLKLSTNSGHVSAKHDVSIKLRLTRREGCSSRADIIVTFTTTVDKKPDYSNIDLQDHEMKHYNAYMNYDKREYNEWYNLDAGMSDSEACKEVKSYIWPNIRDLLTKLINEQNKIDDDDPKNECKDRISLQKTINEMKSAFDAKVCQEM